MTQKPALEDRLWQKLERFALDQPGADLTFTRRLARENGWSHAYASRVVDEYKRFVYLAMIAGHEVTPSDQVDQAWHLHLTYTRSYWQELCGEVLGRPLHHGPTRGGKAEGDRFEDQYERTLASYESAFGGPPPVDIWPPSAIRFGEAAGFVRVNRSRVWVLPKPWRFSERWPTSSSGVALCLAPPLVFGVALNPLNYTGPWFLAFYGVLMAITISIAFVCRRRSRTTELTIDPAEAEREPAIIAATRGSWQAVMHSALASLLGSGAIETEK